MLLLCFDSSRQKFLKTDWSTGGAGYILVQSDDSSDSIVTMKHLADTGECLYDLSLDGSRLRPVLFGSRSNLSYESDYHSFVDEVACERWIIGLQPFFLYSN